MTLVRRLNDAGIQRFAGFLDSLKSPTPHLRPTEILNDPVTSQELESQVDVAERSFASRFEAAKYISEKLDGSGLKDIERDRGLWAWLSFFYFDVLCPVRQGQRKPGELARWVPEVANYQRYYRHLLAGPYRIYRAHRDDPDRAMALLCGALDRPGDIVEQLASRQEIITNKAIIHGATLLYIDPETKKPRRGAGGKGGGSARRLADVLNQLDVTWDLYAMTPDNFLSILPGEFNRFREAAGMSAAVCQ